MNRYNFNQDKGIITTNDDFLFEQTAVRDAFKGILQGLAYGNDVIILTGCEISGSLDIAEGYVMIDGEIYFHAANTYPDPSTGFDGYYFSIDASDDPAGEKITDLTTTTVFVRKIRTLTVTPYTGTIPAGKTDIGLVKRVAKTILEGIGNVVQAGNILWPKLNEVQPNWTELTTTANWSSVTATKSYYRNNKEGYIEIVLNAGKISSGANLIGTLPVGWRPNRKHTIMVSDGEFSYPLEIATNGEVSINASTYWPVPIGGTSGSPSTPLNGIVRVPLVV